MNIVYKKQLTAEEQERIKEKRKAKHELKKKVLKKNKLRSVWLTILLITSTSFLVYTEKNLVDGFDAEEAYKISNVATHFIKDDGYEGRVLTVNPSLTIYGDTQKVKQLKNAEIIPDVELNIKGKSEGIYEIIPHVKDTLIGVNYHFSPSNIEVQVLKAKKEHYDVLERSYGVAKEGYYIERMIAKEQAELLVTSEEALNIGYVVADVDATKITKSGVYSADVVVLDKKGELLKLPTNSPTIKVDITLSELDWYKRQKDIDVLKEEVTVLERELAEKRQLLPTVTDLLQRSDLKKEINFRETRLPIKQKEIIMKEKGLAQAKEKEESLKRKQEVAALKQGGLLKAVKN